MVIPLSLVLPRRIIHFFGILSHPPDPLMSCSIDKLSPSLLAYYNPNHFHFGTESTFLFRTLLLFIISWPRTMLQEGSLEYS